MPQPAPRLSAADAAARLRPAFTACPQCGAPVLCHVWSHEGGEAPRWVPTA